MSSIKLAELLSNGRIGFVYDDPDGKLASIAPDKYSKLVPVVILRHHELGELSAMMIAEIRTRLEEAAVDSSRL